MVVMEVDEKICRKEGRNKGMKKRRRDIGILVGREVEE